MIQKTKRGQKIWRNFTKGWHEFWEKRAKHFEQMFVGRIENAKQARLWIVEWALLLTAIFLLAWVQIIWYGAAYDTQAVKEGGGFSEAVVGKINSMNPLYAATSAEKTLAKLLFANVVATDYAAHNKAELAETVTHDAQRKVWTVKLRQNLKWSDGAPITADDLTYTVELLNDPAAKTTVRVDFGKVKVEKKDDLTVVFTLPTAFNAFLENLNFPLVPAHKLADTKPALVYESAFSKQPVSSGPFKFNAMQGASGQGKALQTIYLYRNEYYARGATLLDNFTLKSYTNTADVLDAMQKREVKATAELSALMPGAKELEKSFNHRNSGLNAAVFAFFNTDGELTRNKALRQAIQCGVNLQSVRDQAGETLRPLSYPILKSQIKLEEPTLPVFDTAMAGKLMHQAGYRKGKEGEWLDQNGKKVSLRMMTVNRPILRELAEALKKEIEAMGIKVQLSQFDEAGQERDFFSSVVAPRDYDILLYTADLGVEADPFVYYSSTQANTFGWNLSNYKNSLVDDALLSARRTAREDLRQAKLELFLKHWVRDVPALAIGQMSLDYYYAFGTKIYNESVRLSSATDRFYTVSTWASKEGEVKMTP